MKGGSVVISLDEDTTVDKVVRFVIGGVLGAVAGWRAAVHAQVNDARQLVALVVGGVVVVGGAAVLFGNTFIEDIIRGRWRL
jgi:hypothetical protein